MSSGARTLVVAWLRRVAGEQLAADIVGDVAESGGGTARLAGLAMGISVRRAIERVRGVGGRPLFSGWRADLGFAVRSLRRSPWYTATVITVIALGMALATTVFAVVDGVLFKPLPYPDAGELYALQGGWRAERVAGTFMASWSDAAAWRAALPEASFALTSPGDRTSLSGDPARSASVSDSFFDVLGQPLLMGGFRPEDFAPRPRGAARGVLPVVLSYGYWQGKFGGDPTILGRVFHGDDGAVSQVVGVTSPSFLYPAAFNGRFVPDVLTALPRPANAADVRDGGLIVIARIPAARAAADLNARVESATAALALRFPRQPGSRRLGPFDTATATPLDTLMRSYQRRTFSLVFATAALLVLLACLNVTGLAAARTEDRVRELTLRRALGGRGADLVRLLAADSAVVVVAGSIAGFAASKFLLSTVLTYLPVEIVLLKTPAVDLRVAAFAAIAAACAIAITTIWPARAILRHTAMSSVGTGARSTRVQGRWGRFALIGTEIALALVMATAGALLAGSLARVWREDPGFQVERVLSFWIGARSQPSFADVDALLADVRRVPGVAHVGGSNLFLLQRAIKGSSFDAPAGAIEESDVESVGVLAGFFEAVNLRPVSGRWPTDGEVSTGAPVALVSERVARDYWHGQPAVGQVLVRGGRPYSVIGVVPDARTVSFDRDPDGAIYYPMAADPKPYLSSLLITCTSNGCADVIPRVTELIERGHDTFRVRSAESLTAALGGSIRTRSFQTLLFASFGVSAILIVGAGVLGLVAMVTSRRTREVGVRMALGARPSQIAVLIVRQEMAAVLAGIAAGVVLSFWSAALVRAYLYKISAYDARVWAGAITLLAATAAAGAFLPARRASRVDPVTALRND